MSRAPSSAPSRAWAAALTFLLLGALPAAGAAQDDDLAWAREAIGRGRYKEGLERLDKLLAKAGGGAERDARMLRVRAYLETGKYKEAAAAAETLATAHPDAPGTRVLYAEALLELGRHEAAAKQLQAALKRNKHHVRARLMRFELARITGDAEAAEEQVNFFFDLYNDDKATTAETLTAVARAVEDEAPHDAWRAYQEAHEADAEYVEAYLRGAFHCFNKYAWRLAKEEFEAALKRNPNLAVAHAGLAAVYLANSKYDDAQKAIGKALAVNPNLSLGLELKAALLAMDHKHDESLKLINQVLAVNANSVDALALLAAHYEALGNAEKRDAAIARVHRINPRNADVYITLAEAGERRRQFPAAVAWAEKAIKINPYDWAGYYHAGMNLLRIGEERHGYLTLEKAFELNGFNVWARNMLTVLDKDLKRKRFVYHRTKHFFVKLERSEDEILWPYLRTALEGAYEKFARKYGIEPTGPKQYSQKILFLMFPKHEDFSARTVGLPGLGALGACFGQVITMPSPRFGKQRPGGYFNWKRVLEHEFVHVLTLQRTGYRIPRWFTEGISTWEEEDPQIQWDRLLIAALARNRLLPLEDINVGFTRPKFPQQVVLSYYHASLVCRYLEENYGFAAIDKMLKLYAKGKQTTEVLPAVTGKDMKTLNGEVLAYVKRYAAQIKMFAPVDKNELARLDEQLRADPDNAKLLVRQAAGQLANRQLDAARNSARRAIQRDPKIARAHGILGYIAYEIDEDFRQARKHFLAAKAADPDYFYARLHLGLLAHKSGSAEEAITELEAARKLYPRFPSRDKNPHFLLAELYENAGKIDRAIAVMRDWVRVNNASYEGFKRLAELLAQSRKERHAEAAAAYLEAIYINPFEADIHLAAGKEYEAAGEHTEAAREYGVAVALDSKSLEALVGRARALAAAGDTRAARRAIVAIRDLDPENAEATKIESRLK